MKCASFLFLFVALFVSCQTNEGTATYELSEEPGLTTRQSAPSDLSTEKFKEDLDASKVETESVKSLMLIKKGNLQFEVENLQTTYEKVKNLVKDFDGYISRESQQQNTYKQSYSLVVRIPANNFDPFILSIDAGVGGYDQRMIEADDVGEEYFNLKIRLENKKALLERYRQLLPRTNKMDEILKLERALQDVSSEIDQIEGRMRYLKDQTSFSTIRINFYKKLNQQEQTSKERSFGARFVKNLQNGWLLIQEFFLGLVQLWPFILLLGIAIVIFWRRRVAKKRF